MSFNPSKRVEKITIPPIVKLNTIAKKYKDVINLGQGIAHFSPPEVIYKALTDLQKNPDKHIYSPDMGMIELRELLKESLIQNKQGDYELDEIMITAGANQAFMNLCLAILDVGDEVIIPSPFYFNNTMAVESVNAKPVIWPMLFKDGTFALDMETLSTLITDRTRMILLITPNNPTGCVYPFEDVKEVIKLAYEKHIFVIIDDTYIDYNFFQGNYDFINTNLPNQHIIHIGSFSKNFGLSGWRCGYITSHILMDELLKIQDTVIICAPIISQLAVIELLKWPDASKFVNEKKGEIKEKGLFLYEGLKNVDYLDAGTLNGAFYLFPKVITDKKVDSETIALQLLEKCRILSLPGSAFGSVGEGHLRISFGFANKQILKEAIERLERYELR